MSKKENANRLLQPYKTVFLITVAENGQPDARAMAIVNSEGLKTIWMLTGKNSDKCRELSLNSRCLVYASDLEDTDIEDTEKYMELRLWGDMELLDDAASRDLAWRDEYLNYFPGGKDDPNLCVMKFTANSGVLQTRAGKEQFTL